MEALEVEFMVTLTTIITTTTVTVTTVTTPTTSTLPYGVRAREIAPLQRRMIARRFVLEVAPS